MEDLRPETSKHMRPSAAARAKTTQRQLPTVCGGSLISVRDDKDSGYVGSARSRHAALSQRSQRATTSQTFAAHVTSNTRYQWRKFGARGRVPRI